ncbi:MAG: SpoIIE family protein phosphatase, partial [Planctomycetota bacterium]
MIGAATNDLVGGLTGLATYCAGEGARSGIWILDRAGSVLARGGASELDGKPVFSSKDGSVRVTGIRAARKHVYRSVDVSGSVRLWLVLTCSPESSGESLEAHADFIVGMLSRAALRDYETDDTTEHLLALFEQVRSVYDLADQLPECDSIEEMGQLGLNSLITAVRARVAGLALREERSEQLKCVLVSEGGSETRTVQIPLDLDSSGPLMQAFVDGKVVYGDIESFDIPPDSIFAEAEHCLMIVPICFGTKPSPEVLGCLIMFDRAESTGSDVPHFGNPEAELTESVGVLLGLILGTRKRVQAEKELQIASAIQETMIPARAPVWPGLDLAARNVTANQVGGDYFDFIHGKSSTRHMIIADVSGHNMASAMAMVMARSQLRSIMSHCTSPADIYGELTRGMYQDLVRNELFITSFLLKLVVPYPEEADEREIVERDAQEPHAVNPVVDALDFKALRDASVAVHVAPALIDYAVRLVRATRDP